LRFTARDRVQDPGFFFGSWFKVQEFGSRVQRSGFRTWGLGFRVQGKHLRLLPARGETFLGFLALSHKQKMAWAGDGEARAPLANKCQTGPFRG